MSRQRTIAEKVTCAGVGLHTGLSLELTLQPARAHSGIVFVRRDRDAAAEIPAGPSAIASTSHATTLASPRDADLRVMTVEHVLAALRALGIDNVRVELDGPEVPAMDGSAAAFVELIHAAGIFVQAEARSRLRVLRPVEAALGESCIRISPARRLEVVYTVDFEHPAIGRQTLRLDHLDAETFERELAGARTFGFLHELGALLRAGLARGGSLENTVVLDEDRVVNTGGLRWPDEFVRHKVLDLTGDLSLLGLPIEGRVEVERGGHALHCALLRALLAAPDAWQIVGDQPTLPPGLALPGLAREA